MQKQGTPLAHLTGRQRFMGLELLSSPEALIPRKETEILATAAIEKILHAAEKQRALVMDVCTGCGNIALACAAAVPNARVLAADLSEQAVSLAGRNAREHGLSGRVEFHCGDLFAPFQTPEFIGQVDVITCNPPYISTAKVSKMPREIAGHEPQLAFNGGPLGVSILMRVITHGPALLKRGGWLGFEVGMGQGPAMERRLRESDVFSQVETCTDAANHIRALFGQKR